MNKKKAGVAFILLLACVLAGQALAQGSDIKFNSNADDLTKLAACWRSSVRTLFTRMGTP